MNTRPDAINVLCYGDSNTWGQRSEQKGTRYAADVRWTGKLQDALGDNYYVIEEGLGGRTTDLEHTKKPGRSGRTYFIPCLVSHSPLDVVIILLGTNDLKTEYNRSAADIANALRGLVSDVREYTHDRQGNTPRIVLVSPILVDDTAELFAHHYTGIYDHESVIKSHDLAGEIAKVAHDTGCIFMDASIVAEPGIDGIHFSAESHPALAALMVNVVRKL